MTHPNRTLKGLFAFLMVLVPAILVIAGFIAIRSLGRIDGIEAAARDLDVRSLRFTPVFRARIYRLQTAALGARMTGDVGDIAHFLLLKEECDGFLDVQREMFTQEKELAILTGLEAKLALYFEELIPGEPVSRREREADPLAEIQEWIGGLEEALRRLGSTPPVTELRWQLQRCHARLLLVYAKRIPRQAEIFQEALDDLRETLAGAEPQIVDDEATTRALISFTAKVARFETVATKLVTRWVEEGSDEKRFADREKLQTLRDDIIEMAQTLGALRQEAFTVSLGEYRSLVASIRYSVFIGIGLLVMMLAIMAWLARLVFLKPVEANLREAEKTVTSTHNLATIGTLAAGVAHEIRNPITAIKARLFALGEVARKDEATLRQVNAIQTETNRMENIVQDFLSFARPSECQPERTETGEFLEEIHALLLPEMVARRVTFQIGRTVEARARIDRDQLTQVFLNLIRNAAEACPEIGGEVVLSSALEGKRVVLSVADNGKGIPEEYLSRIFDPFFSKKKSGTGLGLAICANLIGNHHGNLTCESIEGEGATFSIRLEVA